MVFFADPNQLHAQVSLANYDRQGVENFFRAHERRLPSDGHLCLLGGSEGRPRAVIMLPDLSAEKMSGIFLGKDVSTFAVPYQRFLEMEANAEESVPEKEDMETAGGLDKGTWSKHRGEVPISLDSRSLHLIQMRAT